MHDLIQLSIIVIVGQMVSDLCVTCSLVNCMCLQYVELPSTAKATHWPWTSCMGLTSVPQDEQLSIMH